MFHIRLNSLFLMLALIAGMAAPVYAAETAAGTTANEAQSPATDVKPEDLLKPLKTDHLLGLADAPVFVVEYASLSCHHCADFHKETFPKLKEKYIDTGKVLYAYRHFPFNEPALRGAMLAECDKDKFWSFLNVMFKAQEKWAYTHEFGEALRALANVGGLSNETYNACVSDKAVETRLVSHLETASKVLSVNSTPTLFVGPEKVKGNYNFEALSKIIDEQLEKVGAE